MADDTQQRISAEGADPLLVEMQKLEWSRNAAIKAGDVDVSFFGLGPDSARAAKPS